MSMEVALSSDLELTAFYPEPSSPRKREFHLTCLVCVLHIYLKCIAHSQTEPSRSFSVIGCTFLNFGCTCNSKMSRCRLKQRKILTSGMSYAHEHFCSRTYKGHFGVIGTGFCKFGHNSKMAHRRVKEREIWASEGVGVAVRVVCVWVLLTLYIISRLRLFSTFTQNWAITQKQLSIKWNKNI